jgi:hypothetical protein
MDVRCERCNHHAPCLCVLPTPRLSLPASPPRRGTNQHLKMISAHRARRGETRSPTARPSDGGGQGRWCVVCVVCVCVCVCVCACDVSDLSLVHQSYHTQKFETIYTILWVAASSSIGKDLPSHQPTLYSFSMFVRFFVVVGLEVDLFIHQRCRLRHPRLWLPRLRHMWRPTCFCFCASNAGSQSSHSIYRT